MQSATAPVTPARVACVTAALLGLALASYGGYTQYTIANQLGTGACGGCAPWHPLFVVAPLVGGVLLLASGSYALAKTNC